MDAAKSFRKTVQKREELYIEFTREEMEALGISPGDKFVLRADTPSPGSMTLEKMVPVEIDLEQFDKSVLVGLIRASIEEQSPVDDIIRSALEKFLESVPRE